MDRPSRVRFRSSWVLISAFSKDTDLVILIPIGHSRVFCAFRLVSDDSADSISLFYVNNQYPMTGWGKESKWCIYSPKWSLSPR